MLLVLIWVFMPHGSNIECVCFRCKGCQRQLPGPVGIHQWHHGSDGTRVKGTQLSGILALLWGSAVMLLMVEFCLDLCFISYCFWHMPVLLLLLYLWVGGGKKGKDFTVLYSLVLHKRSDQHIFWIQTLSQNWHLSFMRIIICLQKIFIQVSCFNNPFQKEVGSEKTVTVQSCSCTILCLRKLHEGVFCFSN